MKDYLGLEREKEVETHLLNHELLKASNLISKVWEEEKIASFGFWNLLLKKKGKEAQKFRHDHVMVRDNPIGIYLAFKHCPEQVPQLLKFPILSQEKQRLLDLSLSFGIRLADLKFCQELLAKGANPRHTKDSPLMLACGQKEDTMLKLLLSQPIDPTTKNNYAFKHAFKNQLIGRLDHLKSLLKTIPLSQREVMEYMCCDLSQSIQWMCRSQNEDSDIDIEQQMVTKPVSSGDFFDFSSPLDCAQLMSNYIGKQRLSCPTDYRERTKKYLRLIPTNGLEACAQMEHAGHAGHAGRHELAQLAHQVICETKARKKVMDYLKTEKKKIEEDTAITL